MRQTADGRRPRVLVLTPWAPLPYDAGSRRVWTACRYLADRYDFSLLTFHLAGPTGEGAPMRAASRLADEARHFQGVFRRVRSVEHRPDSEAIEGPWPHEVRRFQTQRMRDALCRAVDEEGPDLVHVEFDLMAPYIDVLKERFPRLPCLLTHHDLGSVSLFQSYFREMADWRRFLRLGDWWRRVAFTSRACRRFDSVVVLTEADGRRMRWLSPGTRVFVAPTGVDLRHFASVPPKAAREAKTLVYVGHYPHFPNEDAVLWFSREILPRLWAQDPGIRFQIVGTGPTAAIKALAADSRILVTGGVPDVRDYEEKATAMVAPLRLGKGIKGKILEGMAAGTPVVATSLANEGIRATAEREILLADSPAAFARQAMRLLRDEGLWDQVSAAGRAFVEAGHSWTARAGQLDAVYRGVLKTSQGATKLVQA